MITMNFPSIDVFERFAEEYDQWYDRHPLLYQSELQALKKVVPAAGEGLEIGVGTGRFAAALNIKTGIEPTLAMALKAKERGIRVIRGYAENLPFLPCSFGIVLLVTTICFLEHPAAAFKEVHRVLEPGGCIITGFIDKNSAIGKKYREEKDKNKFYKYARFKSADRMISMLETSGFQLTESYQTLTHPDITGIQSPFPGCGKGSFAVLKAVKQSD